ncbi:PLP-dependent aminotransferase family protein [Clostridium beijerinckii]|uniref:aminotransferase-like domain-containing protein n=1 Tax=Clostridium beijerinckii TaxID=1520 RepID=UPI001361160F|nr:PLP-dependent aminotransferase family protein [Clostridium beijerinckii]MZK49227.1 aminotransferase class I/II-fold pyridoxal phosphate-dependent enzyme [Clostridium beijerinckii]MZK57058.1 aminotransferase class I/II-fold pyridoxal phosphate-dependent enzyme [Clostridium beijerinckii]MZK67269.1 aminotransferase class I/II-fold pyridoxal phosphate-dependent enzyme [Clostridium beijerinckii]MZK72895.1 aminotransferase class I/II-fold pyridoxal phosphate-dependent enzyme [Clostridium beijerinc
MKKKYEIIIEYIEELAEKNELKQGQRLPAIRTLVDKFECNKSTVIRAYKELEINHRIYSIPKSGYYLVENNSEENAESGIIDFSLVVPDSRLLPYKEFNHCINRAVELYKNDLFIYGDTEGFKSLRASLVNFFSEYQIFTSMDKICITSGSQQAISIVSKMSFPNGKKNILVEQPTYSLIHKLVEINGERLIGINRDFNGINLEELENIFKNQGIKFFYTIPRLHNPLGTSYSEKDKRCIAELAEKYDVYIVEDDYLADLDKNKKSLPIYYYDIWERVVYLKSFSKTFMPGIRLGAVVLQEKLKSEFLKHKRYYDLSTSALEQGALEIYINSGMYKTHIQRIQFAYMKKMNYLKDCLKNIDTEGVELFIPDTGFFIWMQFTNHIDMETLNKRLNEKKIYIAEGKAFFTDSNSRISCFRLCISKLAKDKIKLGLQILFEEIHKLI